MRAAPLWSGLLFGCVLVTILHLIFEPGVSEPNPLRDRARLRPLNQATSPQRSVSASPPAAPDHANEHPPVSAFPVGNLPVKYARLVCIVPIEKQHVALKQSVLDSWGLRCDRLVFFVSGVDENPNPNATTATVGGGLQTTSWRFVRSVWARLGSQLARSRRSRAGETREPWFVWVPTSSYLVADNLRATLEHLDASESLYIGRVKVGDYGPYADGRGYVLSSGALGELHQQLTSPSVMSAATERCAAGAAAWGDAGLGSCLSTLGIAITKMVDTEGRAQVLDKELTTLILERHPRTMNRNGWFSPLFEPDYLLYRSAVDGLQHLHPTATTNVTAINGQNTF